MSFLHVIVTRFSFRFKPTDTTDNLLSTQRLDERIAMFEKFCYSSIINQTNPNFYWIIIIDPLLPQQYIDTFNLLIQRHKSSEKYPSRGPREIWLNQWDWQIDGVAVSTGHKLGRIEWILEYFNCLTIDASKWKYLITTRLDDDDCLVDNYINQVHSEMKISPINGFRYLSFAVGYQHYIKQEALRKYKLPMIALGLTLITEIKKYPMCVYLGCHTHIAGYLRDPKKHADLYNMYLKNKEYPVSRNLQYKQVNDRLKIIRIGEPVWVRNVHDFNLQKNIGRNLTGQKQSLNTIKGIMKTSFGVSL
jgi:hypothetical protein